MTHPQSGSSDLFDSNDKGEGYAAPQVAVLQQQCSTSTIPSAPGADSPNLLIMAQLLHSSLVHKSGTPSHSNMQIGTPLAVGAFKVQRSLSQFTTLFPIHSHQHQPSKLSASFTFSSPLVASHQGDFMVVSNDYSVLSLTISGQRHEHQPQQSRF